ncbi:hypothetical protein O6H91_19G003800 [Diphasiastrum complanatum]|uniref:Uncharacterized protein n=1 Tax=Diphasiastrum complanatum TaxID=34168 RepID=A0ACC2ATL9_DIPCM|nr:hypothetical protein O6H91_19G003800 [Diphasiastrum complanatum]
MFYSHLILSKKGPLGTVWIAAHLEKKLRKSQVNETNISVSVDSILFSEVPIALRLSGHLLLGVVRIYARKVNYLYHDCSEALVKIKHAFHSGAVDLPPEAARAPFHVITLPETFDFDDSHVIPYQEGFHGDFDLHVTEREQITLHDPLLEAFFLAPQREVEEQFQDDLASHEQDKELLFTIPRRGQTSPMQTLEEDVLPPMAMDFEMDENIDRTLEVAFPDGMDPDEQNAASLTPMAIDKTEANVSTSAILEQEQLNVPETDKLEIVEQIAVVEEDISADDIPEVEKLRSAVEPRFDEPDEFAFVQEPLIGDKSPILTGRDDGAFLMEDEELPEQNKEQAHESSVFKDGSLSPLPGVGAPPTSGLDAIPEDDDILASILGGTPSIQVAATPIETPVPSRARGTRRKRQQYFDTATVLPSNIMKHQVENSEDLRRIRRKASVLLFETWSIESDYRMKETFPKASVYGLCPELHELYNQITVIERDADATVSPPNSMPCTPQVGVDATFMVDHSPEHADAGQQGDVNTIDNEICEPPTSPEARSGLQPGTNEVEPVPSPTVPMWIELNQEENHEAALEKDLQPVAAQSTELAHHDQLQVNVAALETTVLTMAGQGEQMTLEAQTIEVLPYIDHGEENGYAAVTLPVEESSQPGLSFLADSAPLENGDLLGDMYSLEGSRKFGSNVMGQDSNGWSSRTRAVAEFLQGAFKAADVGVKGSQEHQFSSLSLDKLLKNKSKKQAARMFFETLVLKTQNYIGVEQVEAYGDIALTARPKLLKAIF